MVLYHRGLFVVAIAIMSALCVPLMWPFLSQAIVIGSCVCAAAALIGCKVIEWKAGSVLLVFDSEMGGVERSPTLIKQWVEAMDARIADNLKNNQIAIRFRVFGGPPIIYVWETACRGHYVWAFENLRLMRWIPLTLAVECKFGLKYSRDYTEVIQVSELANMIRGAHEEILVPLVAYSSGAFRMDITDKLRDLLIGRSVAYQSNLRNYYRHANEYVRALLAKNAVAVAEETVKNERLLALEMYVTNFDRLESLYRELRNTSRFAQTIEGVKFAEKQLDALQEALQELDDVRAGLSPEVKRLVNGRLNELRNRRQNPSPLYLDVERERLKILHEKLNKEKKKA